MYKLGETDTPEEVSTNDGNFKAILFFIRADESIYENLLEDIRKADIVGRDEYPEMIKGAYELLVRTLRQFDATILTKGRQFV